MTLSKKKAREIFGFTFDEQGDNTENWFNRACSFNEAAILLKGSSESSPSIAYYYNAGLSIELLLKAIILAKSKSFGTNHNLIQLSKNSGVSLTKDQECTLELLSEIIIWSGRYPIPKKEGQWNNYHDVIFEKHIIRERDGNTFRTLANRGRFPSIENYKKIWDICEIEYKKSA
ncbi:MAG: HEPN domain-containing protein [Thermodesulfovibrionales bacterium]|nr:HEPN domain-containing protein [Thermodesulfovibrionales bacterium]